MIVLSLGSNLGSRLTHIKTAIKKLKQKCFTHFETSIILETPAILPENAPSEWNKPYLNAVLIGETELTPTELLKNLKEIEKEMGRPEKQEKWSPRIIDLDILLWNQEIIKIPNLTIPHPELFNRRFLVHLIALLSPHTYSPNRPEKTIGLIAHEISAFQNTFSRGFALDPNLVGIVNVTPDSFSDGGNYLNPEKAVEHILKLHHDGASVIDIGAQSTRPDSKKISCKEELERLEPVFKAISPYVKEHNLTLSLDSYSENTILEIIRKYPVTWVNDVKGQLSKEVLIEIAEKGCKIVAMHSITMPHSNEKIIQSIESLYKWAKNTISRLTECGFSKNDIILDPGIGFGKSPYQNLELIKSIAAMKIFGCPLLVGHSRKSYINNSFYPSEPSERDLETIAISDQLREAGIDYLRVHQVADHHRFWVAKKSIKSLQ